MSNNKTGYQNRAAIRGLLKGEEVQYRIIGERVWCDCDKESFIDNDSFSPWHSADYYEWRVKPKTTQVTLTVSIATVKDVVFGFEGVKKELYVKGETVFYIHKSQQGSSYYKKIIKSVNHNETTRNQSYIVFETEEAMNKAYEQIINAQKGL